MCHMDILMDLYYTMKSVEVHTLGDLKLFCKTSQLPFPSI